MAPALVTMVVQSRKGHSHSPVVTTGVERQFTQALSLTQKRSLTKWSSCVLKAFETRMKKKILYKITHALESQQCFLMEVLRTLPVQREKAMLPYTSVLVNTVLELQSRETRKQQQQ